jgi:prepilin-type N-terminal cleavage/methylation domain-containing protein
MQKGFTLLELLIVMVVVGSLMTLAIPRLGAMVEISKSAEAIKGISLAHQSIERCFLWGSPSRYQECDEFDELDIDDPGNSPGSIFDYETKDWIWNDPNITYTIKATRNDIVGGGGGCRADVGDEHWIEITYSSNARIVKRGGGFYKNLR